MLRYPTTPINRSKVFINDQMRVHYEIHTNLMRVYDEEDL